VPVIVFCWALADSTIQQKTKNNERIFLIAFSLG
jgi:hypothetical protein